MIKNPQAARDLESELDTIRAKYGLSQRRELDQLGQLRTHILQGDGEVLDAIEQISQAHAHQRNAIRAALGRLAAQFGCFQSHPPAQVATGRTAPPLPHETAPAPASAALEDAIAERIAAAPDGQPDWSRILQNLHADKREGS